MTFSGALTLTDLNDFITPSQACIKPVEEVKRPEDYKEPGAASTAIHVDSAGSYYEVTANGSLNGVSSSRKLETAQISLNDCLACSGCITSAESVLITMQSHEEVFNFLSTNPPRTSPEHRIPVLSISPQSLASLSASLSSSSSASISISQVLRRLRVICKNDLGFTHVYDTTFARHIALLEHAQEFSERRAGTGSAENKLPMLSSACPGWVCYAEKTHAEMLPFISRSKSPQQVMGTLVKHWLGEKWGKKPHQIYHVTVMPCYDKKLEASRQDFYNDLYSTRDVDCVITTGELELMMRARNSDLSASVPDEERHLSPSEPNFDDLPELLSHPGSSSGSYLQSLISEYLTDGSELSTRTIRNADYEEHVITNKSTGNVVFKGAKCYGFRNLQNVVRKVGKEAGVQIGRGAAGRLSSVRTKRNMSSRGGKNAEVEKDKAYDYVEVMACPSGCVNGGGQLKSQITRSQNQDNAEETSEARWGDKEWTKRVEEAYWHNLPTPPPSPSFSPVSAETYDPHVFANEFARRILVDLCKPHNGAESAWRTRMDADAEKMRASLFRTQYRAVESNVVGLQVNW